MKKRILCLLLAMLMLVSTVSILASCSKPNDNGDDEACEHYDDDEDGYCDECDEEMEDDGGDDEHECVNEDNDGKCDICDKKLSHDHYDDDENGRCDFCNKKMSSGGNSDSGYPEVPWENGDVTLKFMMSEATNSKQNPSGCHRYLAGDSGDKSDLDTLVLNRNSDAAYYTKVIVKYDYYPDTSDYNWGRVNDVIYKNCTSMMSGKPDIYCNFLYDLNAAALNGAFNNLMNQDLDKGNYFQFLDDDYNEALNNKGYMYEFMTSTTLSQHKMYILASDYFLDLVRSFFIVPVNISLLETVGMEITGDLNRNDKFTIEDFYLEVENKDWDYDKVIAYSAAVYSNTGKSNAGEDIEDVIGFAISAGGVSRSGLLYSSNVKIIDKVFKADKEVAGMPGVYGDYEYSYPMNAEPLAEISIALKRLVEAEGVYFLAGSETDKNMTNYGSTAPLAIRSRFCDSKILFGDVMILGALEYTEYQELKDKGGFGVVPVPFHHSVDKDSEEKYLTSIHNNSRPGAIARNTKNFTACTAFLDYQSTHSTQIMNDYYNVNLQANVVDDSEEGGTVRMLQYIRSNVRSVFEKTFEDAIGFYEQDLSYSKWHGLVCSDFTLGEGIRGQYETLRAAKQEVLDTLYKKYPNLP